MYKTERRIGDQLDMLAAAPSDCPFEADSVRVVAL
jgi:hypothetical protein